MARTVDKINQLADTGGVTSGGAMQPIEQRADAVRQFNRFYTRRIGALGAGHLGSAFSLTEVRIFYELAHRDAPTATELAESLDLDKGYLSRALRRFHRLGLVHAAVHAGDRRRKGLRLTRAGARAFAPLDRRARREIVGMLQRLPAAEQRRIVEAMNAIRASLDVSRTNDAGADVVLRPHRPGDMGWVVHRHGALYSEEYGWNDRFEALVARVVADFLENFDPARERCWIAERNGEIIGSIFVVAKSRTVAKLRLLLVEPSARGLGVGSRLVDEVIQFARRAGYRKIVLWTQRELTSARRIYKAAGFRLVSEEDHEMFGTPLRGETWELRLG
jgi:DNA-binding MarR family transcriptional regulator/GNAT superfamily N-acetyltransferase